MSCVVQYFWDHNKHKLDSNIIAFILCQMQTMREISETCVKTYVKYSPVFWAKTDTKSKSLRKKR